MKEQGTMTKWFWWSGWAPESVETWLEEKAAQGWRLVRADRMLLRFHFERAEAESVRVCADFPADPSAEYVALFEDAGWEQVGASSGWRLWRKEYSGAERPEAFTDLDSLIERNTRLLIIMLVGFISGVYLTFINPLFRPFQMQGGTVLGLVMVLVIAAVGLGVVALSRTLARLRARRNLTSG